MAKAKSGRLESLLGIGKAMKVDETYTIAKVRFDEKAEDAAGYSVAVCTTADGAKIHTFSESIFKQLKEIVEEVGDSKFDPPLNVRVEGQTTKSGFVVMKLVDANE